MCRADVRGGNIGVLLLFAESERDVVCGLQVRQNGCMCTAISISPVQLLRQVHPDSVIAQSRWAASSSDYQSVDKLYNDLVTASQPCKAVTALDWYC